MEWTSAEGDAEVLGKVEAALRDPALIHESVHVHFTTAGTSFLESMIVRASAFAHEVAVGFSIHTSKPVLRTVELVRASGSSGVLSTSLGLALWSMLDLSHVVRLRVDEGAGASVWEEHALAAFSSLRVLNASNSGLMALPGSIRVLAGSLQELRVQHNRWGPRVLCGWSAVRRLGAAPPLRLRAAWLAAGTGRSQRQGALIAPLHLVG